MYNRALEQVGISIAASACGMISVFLIVDSVPKEIYGIFISALALQYVIVRVILSGVLVELQLRLAEAVNTNGTVSWTLVVYGVALMILTALVLIALWTIQKVYAPSLGILIGASMLVSIAALAVKSWIWYRASILVPEIILLLLLYLSRYELDLEKLYQIYHIYYGVQGGLATAGLFIARKHIHFSRNTNTTFGNLLAGCIATISTMGRDRLTVAVAGYLFPPTAVAELAYLMTVVKGALSIGGTLNSVKFVQIAGKKMSINLGRTQLVLENLALAALTLLGYLALWFYTLNFGNSSYLGSLTMWQISVMTISVLLAFNHSIWYSNKLIRGQLWIYNRSAMTFFIFFLIFIGFLHEYPFLDISIYYGITQFLLISTASIFWRRYAPKTL